MFTSNKHPTKGKKHGDDIQNHDRREEHDVVNIMNGSKDGHVKEDSSPRNDMNSKKKCRFATEGSIWKNRKTRNMCLGSST